MTLRQHYARPRPRAITHHPAGPGRRSRSHRPVGSSPPPEPAGGLRRWSRIQQGLAAGSGVWAGSCGCPVGVLQAAPCGEPSPPPVTVGPAATAPRRTSHTQPGTTRHHDQGDHNAPGPALTQSPRPPPATGAPAMTGPAPGPADLIHRRHLEKTVSWTGRERLRCLWYRLRLTVAEMNYATRRVVEIQALCLSGGRP